MSFTMPKHYIKYENSDMWDKFYYFRINYDY